MIVYLWRLYLPIYLTFLFFLPSRTTLSSPLFVILSLPFCLKYFQPPSSFSSTFSCPHLVKSVVCHWSYNTWLFLNIYRHTNTHIHTLTHTKWDIWKNASVALRNNNLTFKVVNIKHKILGEKNAFKSFLWKYLKAETNFLEAYFKLG